MNLMALLAKPPLLHQSLGIESMRSLASHLDSDICIYISSNELPETLR